MEAQAGADAEPESRRLPSTRRRERLVFLACVAVWVAALLLSFSTGHYAMTPGEVWHALRQLVAGQAGSPAPTILLQVRLPRIILATLVGAGLAVSGAAYQGLFRNPLVSPDILGVSAGACVGAVIGIFFHMSTGVTQVLAFLAGLVAIAIVTGISRAVAGGSGRLLVLVLSGVVVTAVFQAIITLLKYFADTDDQLPAITYWLMGSFARSSDYRTLGVVALIMVAAMVPLLAVRWQLNVVSFGEEQARSLGVNVTAVKWTVIFCATLLTSVSVALCGVVGWVGLVIPHLVRVAGGANFRGLLPNSFVAEAAFMVLADAFARNAPTELPISVLTALVGAPVFLWMLYASRRELA